MSIYGLKKITKKIIYYDIDDAESVGIKFYKRNEKILWK